MVMVFNEMEELFNCCKLKIVFKSFQFSTIVELTVVLNKSMCKFELNRICNYFVGNVAVNFISVGDLITTFKIAAYSRFVFPQFVEVN